MSFRKVICTEFLLTGNHVIFGWCCRFEDFCNNYKPKRRSHAWFNVLDIIGYKKINRRFEMSHDSCHSSRKFGRIWNLKFISVQEAILRHKCCIKKMTDSYRLRTSIQGPNCKPRIWVAWNNSCTRNGKYNLRIFSEWYHLPDRHVSIVEWIFPHRIYAWQNLTSWKETEFMDVSVQWKVQMNVSNSICLL
jgi:hypothetical protein